MRIARYQARDCVRRPLAPRNAPRLSASAARASSPTVSAGTATGDMNDGAAGKLTAAFGVNPDVVSQPVQIVRTKSAGMIRRICGEHFVIGIDPLLIQRMLMLKFSDTRGRIIVR